MTRINPSCSLPAMDKIRKKIKITSELLGFSNTKKLISKNQYFKGFFFYLKRYQAILLALILSLISLAYFSVTAYSDLFFRIFPNLSIRWFGVFCVFLVLTVALIASFSKENKLKDKLELLLLSLIPIFFCYSYFLGVETRGFYPYIFGVLPTLIFVINYNLFNNRKFYLYLIVIQVMLFSLQTFSLINFFNVDRVAAREFRRDLLALIFNLSDTVWLTICSIAVSYVSLFSLNIKKPLKIEIAYFCLLFFMNFQTLWIIDKIAFIGFLYWQKALIFLVIWDFLFLPIKAIIFNEKDEKYKPRLLVSTAYHTFLILLILGFSLL